MKSLFCTRQAVLVATCLLLAACSDDLAVTGTSNWAADLQGVGDGQGLADAKDADPNKDAAPGSSNDDFGPGDLCSDGSACTKGDACSGRSRTARFRSRAVQESERGRLRAAPLHQGIRTNPSMAEAIDATLVGGALPHTLTGEPLKITSWVEHFIVMPPGSQLRRPKL